MKGVRLSFYKGVAPGQDLTSRETEVMTLLCGAHSKKEIAAALFISPKTVEKHVGTLYAKCGVTRAIQLVHFAIRHGYYKIEVVA